MGENKRISLSAGTVRGGHTGSMRPVGPEELAQYMRLSKNILTGVEMYLR